MMIPFRRWELHELPALTQGSTIEIWSVKTCSALDSPRYVIVFFQTKKADNLHEDVTLFDNANIKSIRLALNSDYYPQERMLLDFSRDQYADAHFNYTEFNKSYHNCQEKRSLVNFAEFKSRPMFVIDCSRRHLGLKSSTVDIKEKQKKEGEPAEQASDKGSSSRKSFVNRRRQMPLPPPGKPGGIDDPLRRGLSGTGAVKIMNQPISLLL
ncbi:unnamed protein product [Phaedon cochleariae]|uniref:Double jelly roll-like domain-containing protein n=1 Tax=Phaedon cochleariae TaxID=80249 RepID=A0A9N9X5T1_PHACE|nr:unnamed protein product [Phaedon cochleariae]